MLHVTETSYCSEKGVEFSTANKDDAINKIDKLYGLLDFNGYVSVSNAEYLLNSHHQMTIIDDDKYGWTNLDNMTLTRIKTTRGGYEWHIALPMAKDISSVFGRGIFTKPDLLEVGDDVKYDPYIVKRLLNMLHGSKLFDSTRIANLKFVGPELDKSGADVKKMSPETFQKLLDELDGNSLQTLKDKNARYAKDGDSLHNFRSGAEIMGGTPAQACWGYMTKHLTALRDKVESNDFSDKDDFLEKCQDIINYIRFLWCIGNEENTNKKD